MEEEKRERERVASSLQGKNTNKYEATPQGTHGGAPATTATRLSSCENKLVKWP